MLLTVKRFSKKSKKNEKNTRKYLQKMECCSTFATANKEVFL